MRKIHPAPRASGWALAAASLVLLASACSQPMSPPGPVTALTDGTIVTVLGVEVPTSSIS